MSMRSDALKINYIPHQAKSIWKPDYHIFLWCAFLKEYCRISPPLLLTLEGRFSARFWSVALGISPHSVTRAFQQDSLVHCWCSSSSQRCSVFLNHVFMDLTFYTGVLSCWNKFMSGPGKIKPSFTVHNYVLSTVMVRCPCVSVCVCV